MRVPESESSINFHDSGRIVKVEVLESIEMLVFYVMIVFYDVQWGGHVWGSYLNCSSLQGSQTRCRRAELKSIQNGGGGVSIVY